MTKKTVATSYLTIERYSNIRCVEKCYAEKRQGRCTIAAFNKASSSCRLSMDSEQDVVDAPDDWSGIYIFQHEPQGSLDNNSTMSSSNIKHFPINQVNRFIKLKRLVIKGLPVATMGSNKTSDYMYAKVIILM